MIPNSANLDEKAKPSRVLLTAAVLFAAVLIAASFVYETFGYRESFYLYWSTQRLTAAIEALPRIARTAGKLVLMVGSSDVEVAYDPIRVDDLVRKNGVLITSYNFGFRQFGDIFFEPIAERVRHDFNAENRKADLIIVKIPTSRLTVASNHYEDYTAVRDAVPGLIYWNTPMLAHHFKVAPEQTVHWLINAGIFNGLSPEILSLKASNWIFGMAEDLATPDASKTPWENYLSIWQKRAMHPLPAWNLQKRGEFNFGLPHSMNLYSESTERLATADVKKAMLEQNQTCCDIIDLKFDPELVAHLVAAVKIYQQIADHVVIIYTPDNPEVQRPPAAQARIQDLLEELRTQTGAPLLDLSAELSLTQADFFDATHFSQSGRDKFMEALGRQITKILRE